MEPVAVLDCWQSSSFDCDGIGKTDNGEHDLTIFNTLSDADEQEFRLCFVVNGTRNCGEAADIGLYCL